MDLHYSNKELDLILERVNRSIKALEDNGTLIGEEHNLVIIKKLIEENQALKEELLELLQ